MLTSEFQAAVLLRCEDESEKLLVDYLCHGQGLLLLQLLCILASKVMYKIIRASDVMKWCDFAQYFIDLSC